MRQNFNTLLQSIQQNKLFPPTVRLLVAVSGGADSLALLHWLVQHQQALQISLYVATLNHGIRAAAADDVAFVQRCCADWNVPCTTAKRDVPFLAKQQNLSLEAAARLARYTFLATVAENLDIEHIVTAHHADDQSETILMHLLRGSGLRGLIGMQQVSPVPYAPHLRLIRPLLHIQRSEIDQYCEQHQLHPRVDATNIDTTYLRNEIRLQILPRLRQINPQLDQSLSRLSEIVSAEDEFTEKIYQDNYRAQADFAERVTIRGETFNQWHLAMKRRFLVDALTYLQCEPLFERIESAIALAVDGQVGAIAEFSGNTRLRIGYEDIYVESSDTSLSTDDFITIEHPTQVNIPGETIIGEYVLLASETPLDDANARLNIPETAIVCLRTRLVGDKFQPFGLNGKHQKIKKWLIDNKVPKHVRDQIPLVIVNDIIAAIILRTQWRIAETFAENETSQRIIYFKVKKM